MPFPTDRKDLIVTLDQIDDAALAEQLAGARTRVQAELRKSIVGQDAVIEQALVALLAGGNCLIVGTGPGLSKIPTSNQIARR